MKKIAVIALALISMNAFAQRQNRMVKERESLENRAVMAQLSAEEIASLQTKRMTLRYDLTDIQQKKLMALNLEDAQKLKAEIEIRMAKRKARKAEIEKQKDQLISRRPRLSKEERLERMHKRLDIQIERKSKMKELLNDDQYQKWQADQERVHALKKERKNRRETRKHKMH